MSSVRTRIVAGVGLLCVGATLLSVLSRPYLLAALNAEYTQQGLATATIARLTEAQTSRAWLGYALAPVVEALKVAVIGAFFYAVCALVGAVPGSWSLSWALAGLAEGCWMLQRWAALIVIWARGSGGVRGVADLDPPLGLDVLIVCQNAVCRGFVSMVNPFDAGAIGLAGWWLHRRGARWRDVAWWCVIVAAVVLTIRVLLIRLQTMVTTQR